MHQDTWAHRAALISISISLEPDTCLHCETTEMGLVHHVVFTHFILVTYIWNNYSINML